MRLRFDGDGKEDITYQFRFRTDTRNGDNVRQFYMVRCVDSNRRTGTARQIGGELQESPAEGSLSDNLRQARFREGRPRWPPYLRTGTNDAASAGCAR